MLSLPPAQPRLQPLPGQSPPGQLVLQLQGQVGVPYILQSSTNLTAWTAITTNLLSATTLSLTNAVSPDGQRQFWRALWQP